jgi:hypothetical protein
MEEIMKSRFILGFPLMLLILGLLSSTVTAQQCSGDSIWLSSVNPCWQGDTIKVTVNISGDETFDGFYLNFSRTQYLNYLGVDFTNSPWTGTHSVNTVGNVTYVTLTPGTGTLSSANHPRRVFDLSFQVNTTGPFNTTHYVDFYSNEIAHRSDQSICNLITLLPGGSSGRSVDVTPAAVVTVYLDATDGFSSQAYGTDDYCKDDSVVSVPLRLYTNFPHGYFDLWFQVPNNAGYVNFQSLGENCSAESALVNGDYIYFISGFPNSRPSGGGSPVTLGAFKIKIADFRSNYMSNNYYHTSLSMSLIDPNNPPLFYSHVHNWEYTKEVVRNDMTTSIGAISLPTYRVATDIKDATMDPTGHVSVPVSMRTTFWSQDYLLNVGFLTAKLGYDTVITMWGGYRPVAIGTCRGTLAETTAYRFESSSMYQDCKFNKANQDNVQFFVNLHATTGFRQGQTTPIQFFNYFDYGRVYDWFSPDGVANKIYRESYLSTYFWTESDGIITYPVWYNTQIGTIWNNGGTVYKIPILITQIGIYAENEARIGFDFDRNIDSVTTGDFYIWPTISGDHISMSIGAIEETGVLANLWTTVPQGVSEPFILLRDDSWIESDQGGVGLDSIRSAYGDTASVGGSPRLDPGVNLPIVTSLEQNYPNPFNGTTMIHFSLGQESNVQLVIIDILGRTINTLASGSYLPGQYSVVWDGKNSAGVEVSAGTYFYALKTDVSKDIKKMSFVK